MYNFFLVRFFPDKVPMRWSQNTHVRIKSWGWNAENLWRSEYTRQNSDAWSLETPSVHIKTLVIWTARRQIRGIKWLRGARTDASVQSEQIAHILGIHAPRLTSTLTLYMVVVSTIILFSTRLISEVYINASKQQNNNVLYSLLGPKARDGLNITPVAKNPRERMELRLNFVVRCFIFFCWYELIFRFNARLFVKALVVSIPFLCLLYMIIWYY